MLKTNFSVSIGKTVTKLIRDNKPPKGLVQILTVTEKQFAKMEYVTGEFQNDVISDDRRVVIL